MIDKIKEIETHLKKSESEISSLEGKIDFISEALNKLEINISDLEEKKLTLSKAVEFLTFIEKVTREKTKDEIEIIVSYAIQYIFKNKDEAKLTFDKRGNLPKLDFGVLLEGSDTVVNPINAEGGGLADAYSLALRIVLLSLTRNDGFLVMDEPFRHLDKEHQPIALDFILELNKKLNKQVIMVTHNSEFIGSSNCHNIEIK